MLTKNEMLVSATKQLESAGYSRIDSSLKWSSPEGRAFEDIYGVVGLFVFETWSELKNQWSKAQGLLVELISNHLSRTNPKTWDGYLILLTPGEPPNSERYLVEELRYDTNRARKIVGTGPIIRDISDLSLILTPLFPFEADTLDMISSDPLQELPAILKDFGLEPIVIRGLIQAYQDGTPLMNPIYKHTD